VPLLPVLAPTGSQLPGRGGADTRTEGWPGMLCAGCWLYPVGNARHEAAGLQDRCCLQTLCGGLLVLILLLLCVLLPALLQKAGRGSAPHRRLVRLVV
jgi:hypothetical protein